MQQIVLYKERGVALVDDWWFEPLSRYRWHLSKKGYAQRSIRPGKSVMMHTVVAMAPTGLRVDHRNLNKLDNQSHNLRYATDAQNSRNHAGHCDRIGRFKGVSWKAPSGKWQAAITIGGKKKYLGIYASDEDAALAYDLAAIEHFGEFAYLNFPKAEKAA